MTYFIVLMTVFCLLMCVADTNLLTNYAMISINKIDAEYFLIV
jgi:hypothetical protein